MKWALIVFFWSGFVVGFAAGYFIATQHIKSLIKTFQKKGIEIEIQ